MLYSVELEKNTIACLLKYPSQYAEVSLFINESDYYVDVYRVIFSIIKLVISKGEEVSPFIIAEKIKSMKVSFEDEIEDIYSFLDALNNISVNEDHVVKLFKDLKLLSKKREISDNCDKIKKYLQNTKDHGYLDIINNCDKAFNEKIQCDLSIHNDDAPNLFETLEEVIEERGNNPIKENGFMGPFETVNRIYGSLLKPGNVTLIGARTGIGKSSIGMFYLTQVAEKYDVPVLNLDCGELTEFECQIRIACMLARGRVPAYFLETGEWRNNPEWVKIMRQEIWPRVKKLRMYYYNVGGMDGNEIISLIRRFKLSKIGRDNPLLVHYDYLKPFDLKGHETEWQQMGRFLKDLKSFITREVQIPIWTSLQLNKEGITGNKKIGDYNDTDSAFSLSDRIGQQVSHSFILRRKTPDEIAIEGSQFGNSKLIPIKARHLGRDFQDHFSLVRFPDGKLVKNYVNLNVDSFHYEDCNDANSVAAHLAGQIDVDQPNQDGDSQLI